MALQRAWRLACTAAAQGGRSFSAQTGRSFSAQAHGAAAAAAQRTLGAALVERLPVIIEEPPEWEVEHQQWLAQYRTDSRKEYPQQFINPKGVAGGSGSDTSALWQPGPRVTEADVAGDVHSLDRKLEQRLLLLLKSPGAEGMAVWHLPHTVLQDGETLRDGAERAVREQIATAGTQTYTLGNVPAAHHPQPDGSGVLFYVKMQLIEGVPRTSPPSSCRWYDYAWVAADEVPQYFEHDPGQARLLQELL